MDESREKGRFKKSEEGKEDAESAVKQDERRFFADMEGEGKAVREKAAERLFGDTRDFVRGLAPEAASALRPFLEKASSSSDVKTAEEAKVVLARLDLGAI